MKKLLIAGLCVVCGVLLIKSCESPRQSSSDLEDAYRKMHEAGRKAGYSDKQIDDLAKKAIDAKR